MLSSAIYISIYLKKMINGENPFAQFVQAVDAVLSSKIVTSFVRAVSFLHNSTWSISASFGLECKSCVLFVFLHIVIAFLDIGKPLWIIE